METAASFEARFAPSSYSTWFYAFRRWQPERSSRCGRDRVFILVTTERTRWTWCTSKNAKIGGLRCSALRQQRNPFSGTPFKLTSSGVFVCACSAGWKMNLLRNRASPSAREISCLRSNRDPFDLLPYHDLSKAVVFGFVGGVIPDVIGCAQLLGDLGKVDLRFGLFGIDM